MKAIVLIFTLTSAALLAADVGQTLDQAAKDTGKEINRVFDKFAETLKSKDSKKENPSDSNEKLKKEDKDKK